MLLACLLTLSVGNMSPSQNPAPTFVNHLRCDQQVDPLAISSSKPNLSWQIQQAQRGAKQTAYQILVASSLAQLKQNHGDIWDSGQVKSDVSILIPYAGKRLKAATPYFWKVRIWDQTGKPTAWSPAATWSQGIDDWKAQWIQPHPKETFAPVDPFDDNPAPLLRKSFTVQKPVKRATLYASGLGYFELHLNGKKVGDHQLDPGWTDFARRVSYSTFDLTKHLVQGKNALGAMLGNGFFNPLPLKMWGHLNLREHLAIGDPRLIAQLEIEYTDGTREQVVTDPTWRTADGPIIRNSVYLGEVYDARAEIPNWNKPGFDDKDWGTAIPAQGIKALNLQPLATPPIRITKTLKPVHISEPKPGVFIVDFGQNFAGVTRMRVKGSAGTRVRLRSGELLYADGTLNGMTSVAGQHKGGGKDYVYPGKGEPKTAFQIDEYICSGKGTEVFQPRFTFHGFRYVEVTGYPGKPTLEDFEGLRMNSDVERVGSFECSNPMFNRIQTMVEWTLLSNLFSVQSDCPHREKFGYGGDQVATSEMAMYTFDMQRFYANTIDLLREAQRGNGGFTETAPYVGISDEGLGEQSGPIGWGTAFPQLFMDLHHFYGTSNEPSLLDKDNWSRWVALIFSNMKEETPYLLKNGIGDHETLAPKSTILTGSAFMYLNVALAEFQFVSSGYVPQTAEIKRIISDAINTKLLDRKTGKYDIGTQCCQAMPLALGLVPKDMKAKVLDVLIKDIQAHDYHLTTGIFGTKYVLEALDQAGRNDIAYKIVNQKTFPGWGHMLENGATTLWEHWEFSDNTFSHNHPMFGSVSEWFYKAILGIRPAAPGFKKVEIKPSVVGDLTHATGHHDGPYGRIETTWERTTDKVQLKVTIPANTTATVYVPATEGQASWLDGDIASSLLVMDLGRRGAYRAFHIESGTYHFEGVFKSK